MIESPHTWPFEIWCMFNNLSESSLIHFILLYLLKCRPTGDDIFSPYGWYHCKDVTANFELESRWQLAKNLLMVYLGMHLRKFLLFRQIWYWDVNGHLHLSFWHSIHEKIFSNPFHCWMVRMECEYWLSEFEFHVKFVHFKLTYCRYFQVHQGRPIFWICLITTFTCET